MRFLFLGLGLVPLISACGQRLAATDEPTPLATHDEAAVVHPFVPASDAAEALRRQCAKVECGLPMTVTAHLDEPPEALAAGLATIRVCQNAKCRDLVINKETANSWDAWGEEIRSQTRAPDVIAWFSLHREERGSSLQLSFGVPDATGAARCVDGDRVSVRVVLHGEVLVDARRSVTCNDAYPNGESCAPRCRQTTFAIASKNGD